MSRVVLNSQKNSILGAFAVSAAFFWERGIDDIGLTSIAPAMTEAALYQHGQYNRQSHYRSIHPKEETNI